MVNDAYTLPQPHLVIDPDMNAISSLLSGCDDFIRYRANWIFYQIPSPDFFPVPLKSKGIGVGEVRRHT